MISKKVVLTYKRKRSSSQSEQTQCVEDTKLSPKSPKWMKSTSLNQRTESSTFNGKQEVDIEQPSNACDVDGNLVVCNNCSGTYHLQCSDPPAQSSSERTMGGAACTECDSGEPVQQQTLECNRETNDRCIEESDMGLMRYQSHKVLLQEDLNKENCSKSGSSTAHSPINKNSESLGKVCSYTRSGSPHRVQSLKRDSGSLLLDLNITESSSPAGLDMSTKPESATGLPDESLAIALISEKNDLLEEIKTEVPQTKTPQKHKLGGPLITFQRRVKKKKEVDKTDIHGEPLAEKILEDPAVTCNKPESNSNCKYGIYYRKRNPTHQSSEAESSREKSSPIIGKDMIVNVEDNIHNPVLGDLLQTEIRLEGSPCHRVDAPNSCHQLDAHSEPIECEQGVVPLKFTSTCSSTVVMKDSSHEVVHENKQIDIGSSLRKESRVRLTDATEKTEQVIMPDAVGNDRDSLNNLDSSAEPPVVEDLYSLANVESSGQDKGLQLLKTFDEKLLVKQKEKTTSPSIEKGGINYMQAFSVQSSHMKPVDLNAHNLCETAPRENMDQPMQFQERVFLTNSAKAGFETRHCRVTEKSSLFSNFLGLSPPQSEAAANSSRDFGSIPSVSGLSHKDSYTYDGQLSWQTSNGIPHITRIGKVLDNHLAGTRIINQGQGFSLDFKRLQRTWSEEELDSLWIGVRRHGRNNWNAMLTDPRLYFSEWRNAEDLADRWDIEQSKLFNGTVVRSPDSTFVDASAKSMVGNFDGSFGDSYRACSGFAASRTETNLSLGDVYHRNMENHSNRKSFKFSDLAATHRPTANSNLSAGCSYVASYYSKSLFWKSTGIRQQRPFGAHGPSILDQNAGGRNANVVHQPACFPANEDLPHWLKEVVGMPPPRLSEPTLLSAVSADVPPDNQLGIGRHTMPSISDLGEPSVPSRDLRRGILKRSAPCSGIIGNLKASEAPLSTTGSNMVLPKVGWTSLDRALETRASDLKYNFDLNKVSPDPVRRTELVVIDSDASSEETISDDGRA